MAQYLDLGHLIVVLKWILRIGGLWKPQNGNSIFARVYTVYSWCFIFVFSFAYTAFMCANLLFLEGFADLPEMLFMSMTELALVLKIINFYVNNSRLQQMLQYIRDFRLNNDDEVAILRSRLDFLFKSLILFAWCANSMCTDSTRSAAFSHREKLIYSGYYPGVDWRNNAVAYWCIFGYQYVGMTLTCQLNLAIDTYFYTMMYLLSGQIIILGKRLAVLGKGVDAEKRTMMEHRSLLVENIKIHSDITDFIRNLQHCLWWSFSCQLVLSAVTVGSAMNEVLRSSVMDDPFTYVTNIMGAAAFVLQIFLMCFHGQCIMSESDELPMQTYESNWPEMINPKRHGDYGKLILIFMQRMKDNGRISIGMLFPLALSTFQQIMSTAYRLLAIFR